MKQNKFLIWLPFAIWMVLATACQCSAQKEGTVLKFNLQTGKTYGYQMVMNMNSETQGQKIAMAMNFDYELLVTGDSAGVKTIKTVYKRIAMDMNLPGHEVAFDSEKQTDSVVDLQKNPGAMMNKMFGAMVNKGFVMKVDPEGKVIAISGVNEMFDAMMGAMQLEEGMKAQVHQVFEQQFNEESLKQTFSQSFNIFPNKRVKVSDKWEKDLAWSIGPNSADAKTIYTVKDIQKDKVVLNVDADITSNGNKIKQTGVMDIDPASGLVLNANLEQAISGAVNGKTVIRMTGSVK